jgi:hypothetical protein
VVINRKEPNDDDTADRDEDLTAWRAERRTAWVNITEAEEAIAQQAKGYQFGCVYSCGVPTSRHHLEFPHQVDESSTTRVT